MKIGILGTGAIAHKHVQAYRNIGWEVTACANAYEPHGRAFAGQYGIEFAPSMEALCAHPDVAIVDVCTFPDIRLQPVELCKIFTALAVSKYLSMPETDFKNPKSQMIAAAIAFTPAVLSVK